MDNSDNNRNNSYRLPVFLGIGAALLIIIISAAAVLTSDPDGKNTGTATPVPRESSASLISPEPVSETFDAIVAEVNTDDSVIVLIRLGSTEFEEYTYTGATRMLTSYGRLITPALLHAGDFVTVKRTGENRIGELTGMGNVDVYKGVRNLVCEPEIKRLSIGDAVYRYDDSLLVLNDGYFVPFDTLYRTDILTVCSMDGFVYLLKVTSGHGYLRLANDSAFIGGTLTVGTGITAQIEEDMLLTLSEGTYRVTARNQSLSAEGTLLVSRDKTAVFDLAPFSPEPVEYCNVSFTVDPSYAFLYVDGILTPFDDAVPITYGEHRIEVMLGGYTPYEGILYASKPSAAVSVSLQPAPEQKDNEDILYNEDSYTEEEPEDVPEQYPDIPDNTTDTETGAPAGPSSAGGTSLIIHCTEGTAVYIDDVYKGTITDGSLVTDKPSGTVVLTLKLEGCIDKHYTISPDDDGEDAEFTFPAMVRE